MKFKLFILSLFLVQNSFGQRIVSSENQIWMAYSNQTRISNKWGIWFDTNFRSTENFIERPSKFVIRAGAIYFFNENLRFTNGYAFINHYPDATHLNDSQPEHRIWHNLQLFNNIGKIQSRQSLRLEERYRQNIVNGELSSGFRFDERIRANYTLIFPLNKKGIKEHTFSLLISDEVMFNISKNNVYNIFDQNRIFGALVYNLSKNSTIQLGYMNTYQQLSAGNKYVNTNTMRLNYLHNLDFRKK